MVFDTMTHTASSARVVVAAGCLVLAAARPVDAYVDPGSGGMLVQLLIGGLIAGVVAARSAWQRLQTFLGRRRSSRPDDRE
jgi:hypothetical protein